jgi:CDP-glucose 4,6-dehydratase
MKAAPAWTWPERRVLVTGASGMVGSWLVKELLARGATVVALVRDTDPQSELFRSGDVQRIAVVDGQLEDFWTLERAINEREIDTVFHLGAQTIVGTAQRFPLPTFESNIRGTYNLLEACRIHQGLVRRVVIASSDKAYGEQPTLPYVETLPLQGRYPYEVSKSCADLIAQSYHHSYGLPVAIARCGNVYGGGDLNWSRIVPGTIRVLLHGQSPVIRSDGTYVRDYTYVKDAALAYLALAEGLDHSEVRGEAFNFSGESPISVLELVRIIQRLMDATDLKPDVRNEAQGEIHRQYLSAAKAHADLGWGVKYTLEQGLRETIAWYRHFFAGTVR